MKWLKLALVSLFCSSRKDTTLSVSRQSTAIWLFLENFCPSKNTNRKLMRLRKNKDFFSDFLKFSSNRCLLSNLCVFIPVSNHWRMYNCLVFTQIFPIHHDIYIIFISENINHFEGKHKLSKWFILHFCQFFTKNIFSF